MEKEVFTGEERRYMTFLGLTVGDDGILKHPGGKLIVVNGVKYMSLNADFFKKVVFDVKVEENKDVIDVVNTVF